MAKTFKGSLYRFAPVSEKTNIHVASKENAYQCPVIKFCIQKKLVYLLPLRVKNT